MINVLINAYACAPNMGSEPGMAWNWIVNLAKHCNLHVITEGEWRKEIEESMENSPVKGNVQFYYLPVSDEIRHMCWNQGDWRFYYHYRVWQKRALNLAHEIVDKEPIDILHQLNMIGFREPGYLWKISSIPFIWGPIDAKAEFPLNYLKGASIKTKAFVKLKNQLTLIQLNNSSRVRSAVKNASSVIAASSDSLLTIKKYFQYQPILLNETGCYPKKTKTINKEIGKKTFDILWVGKFDFRKQLSLALRTISKLDLENVNFHIIGDNENFEGDYNQKLSQALKIESQCIWHGIVTHQKVQEIMQSCDLLFFTSVAEGTPHVILEAIGNKLPVLCFNTCGHGDVITESIGIKIDLSTPKQSIEQFSEKITFLFNNRDILSEMSNNCLAAQENHSWGNKAKIMLDIYKKCIKPNSKN